MDIAKHCSTHPKVWGTCRKDDPVSPDELPVSGERHVHEALLLQECVHHGEDGGPVVVPFQAELLPNSSVSARTQPRVVCHPAQPDLK